MLAVGERRHAVEKQPRRATPYHHVAGVQQDALRLIAAFEPAEQESTRQAQRDGHDRLAEVALVAVLMQAHLGAGLVAVDQTGVGQKTGEPRGGRGAGCEVGEDRRHCRPRPAGIRVVRIIAIAGAVGHPAGASRVGYGHGHRPARGHHAAERRRGHDVRDRRQQPRCIRAGESPEHGGAVANRFALRAAGFQAAQQIAG